MLAMASETLRMDATRVSCSDECSPPTNAQSDPFAEEAFSGPFVVTCNAGGCAVGFHFNPSGPLSVEEDGTLVASGTIVEGIRCGGITDPTTFALRMTSELDGDRFGAAEGQLVVSTDEATALSNCGTRSRTYDFTVSRA
jgi:hypothetical protein